MKLLISKTIWVVLILCLPGCSKLFPLSTPAAPTNVQVVNGDSSATVTWDMVPGVQYFIYWAPVTGITPDNCGATPTCLAAINVSSPYVLGNLTNGTTYSVAINGRTNGGPGGPSSTSIAFTPALAGNAWTTGTPLGNDLQGITYGTIVNNLGVDQGGGYVAVGVSGALYSGIASTSSPYGIIWTALANPLQSANLNAIANSGAIYLAVGAGGTMLYSSNYSENWVPLTPVTSYDLYAIYNAGSFIATGQNGTLLTSDVTGTVWTSQSSGTSANLRGITAGNGIYVAVGDAGTLLTSTDAVNWTANTTVPSLIPSANLKGVTYGYEVSATTGAVTPIFVAVADNGKVLTSTDTGATWTPIQLSSSSSVSINAVTFGRQFVAVDSAGNVYNSIDGVTWTNPFRTTSGALYAVTRGLYDYSAVGAGGLNIHSM